MQNMSRKAKYEKLRQELQNDAESQISKRVSQLQLLQTSSLRRRLLSADRKSTRLNSSH